MNVASIFGDHMVLQQGKPIPVWGWGSAGETITATFAGHTAQAVAAKAGKWSLEFPAVDAGGPFDMTIQSPVRSVVFRDVLVGEVWIASGQSNMDWTVCLAANATEEIANANHSQMRLFTVAHQAVVEPERNVQGSWSVCDPETVGSFSAVAYYFGRELQRNLGVPVGLINSSVGGTKVQAWMSRESLCALPGFREFVEDYEKRLPQFAVEAAAFEQLLRRSERETYPPDPGNVGFGHGWADPATDVSGWREIKIPGYWQGAGLDFSGVVWFRREVELPADWAGQELTLNLCACDKQDTTYFNGIKVGEMGWEAKAPWETPRQYRIPAGLAKAGRNTVAVRVYSYAYAGGIMGPATELNIAPLNSASSQSLRGPWRFEVEHNFGKVTPISLLRPLGPGNPNSPYSLFNGMIQPLIPYGLRGAIWYQGESDVDIAAQYCALFAAMINGWRKAWGGGEFPFLFVQLANYFQVTSTPVESCWAELREAQRHTLQVPQTAMAVTIDLGDASDIHPRNKQDVGKRLAVAALNQVYGFKDIPPSGPLFADAKVEGNTVRVGFDHASGGLVAGGARSPSALPLLTGFAIAAADRGFVPAEATINGDSVVVSSAEVSRPAAVRYAWANNPVCNLYNGAGLPASPFEYRF